MSKNDGLYVEDSILVNLNGKKVSEVSNNLRFMLKAIYGALDDEAFIKCSKTDDAFKPDLVIEINGVTKYVSVKTGSAENVHNEVVGYFVDYLKSEGISDKTIETILLYQYGDGTTDGSGTDRKGYLAIRTELDKRIKQANEELNWNKEFVFKTIYRCILQGVNDKGPMVDAIYFGTKDYGITCTRKQLLTHIRRRNFSYFENLHIGPLLLRPHSRYSGTDVKSERNKSRIVAYWPNLNADLNYIANRYDY